MKCMVQPFRNRPWWVDGQYMGKTKNFWGTELYVVKYKDPNDDVVAVAVTGRYIIFPDEESE